MNLTPWCVSSRTCAPIQCLMMVRDDTHHGIEMISEGKVIINKRPLHSQLAEDLQRRKKCRPVLITPFMIMQGTVKL